VAKVDQVIEDSSRPDHFYALVSDYLDFDRPVPFKRGDVYYETALQRDDGATNKGAFGRAVLVPDPEFERILSVGFSGSESPADHGLSGFAEEAVPFLRPLVELTVTRPFREQAFTRAVRDAYENRCALTGLRLINGGGRPEVQAAHIMPVALNGPDSVRNGVALSGTIHWMFDRGLLSIDSDYRILTAPSGIPDAVRCLLNKDGRLLPPRDEKYWPHPQFLRFHREHVFKG
jgi:putative restriction endonuclease